MSLYGAALESVYSRSATSARAAGPRLTGTSQPAVRDEYEEPEPALLQLPSHGPVVAQCSFVGEQAHGARQVDVERQRCAVLLGHCLRQSRDEVFTVHSLTYGALALRGRTVAGFGKSYNWVGGRRVNLPSYVESGRSGHTAPRAYGETCPVHFVAMSLSGVCDDG